jgi:hypothetical protein
MARFSCPTMDEDAHKLERVWQDSIFRIAERFDIVWCHVDGEGKSEFIVDFAASHRRYIKVEPFEVENQMVRNVFEARTEQLLMVATIESYRIHLPLDGINMSIARSARVLVVCKSGYSCFVSWDLWAFYVPPCITSPSTYACKLSSSVSLPLISH